MRLPFDGYLVRAGVKSWCSTENFAGQDVDWLRAQNGAFQEAWVKISEQALAKRLKTPDLANRPSAANPNLNANPIREMVGGPPTVTLVGMASVHGGGQLHKLGRTLFFEARRTGHSDDLAAQGRDGGEGEGFAVRRDGGATHKNFVIFVRQLGGKGKARWECE